MLGCTWKRDAVNRLELMQVRDARVAEQLVSSVHQDSVQGEMNNAPGAVRITELELEIERLASRAEHLRAQNDVLLLTLAESRAMGERLAVVLGKQTLSRSRSVNRLIVLCFSQGNTNRTVWRCAWPSKERIGCRKLTKSSPLSSKAKWPCCWPIAKWRGSD